VTGDRLTVGVAARLSRYLQVLTQAKKMGRERISSQEISAYTNINATQIRRDLSAFGKFGKRGVGYKIDSLLGEIRKILRTQGQHNIALIGAGRLGQAIASSPIFAEHGINIAAVFDTDGDKVGLSVGHVTVSPYDILAQSVRDKNMLVGVMAVPASAAQPVANDLIEAGVKIIFNYSEALLDVPPGRAVAHVEPGGRAADRAVLPPHVAALPAGQRATNGSPPRSTSSRSTTPPSSPSAGRLLSRPISATATARGPNAVLSRDVDLSARASLALVVADEPNGETVPAQQARTDERNPMGDELATRTPICSSGGKRLTIDEAMAQPTPTQEERTREAPSRRSFRRARASLGRSVVSSRPLKTRVDFDREQPVIVYSNDYQ